MKIISNYKISDDRNVDKVSKVPKVAKNTLVQESEVEIDLADNIEKNKKITKPEIKVNRNSEQIITSIDVFCSCGEKFTIELEY